MKCRVSIVQQLRRKKETTHFQIQLTQEELHFGGRNSSAQESSERGRLHLG